ncbi:unnamed protein product [Prunus armeniaca]
MPKIEVINLSLETPYEISYQFDEVLIFDNAGDEGLCALAKGCPKLSKLGLEPSPRSNWGVIESQTLVSRFWSKCVAGFDHMEKVLIIGLVGHGGRG